MNTWGKLGLIAGGVLLGTAGVKILTSADAKKVYAHTTAAVIRGKNCVMKTVDTVREGCGDIYADAKQINADRDAQAEAAEIPDIAVEITEE